MENDSVEIEDLGTTKTFFTILPNIVARLIPDAYARAYYWELKQTAGDKGRCFKSQKTLCESIGCKPTKLRQIEKYLSQPFKQLGGKPLIRIKHQRRSDGGKAPNLIQIVDIWPENNTAMATGITIHPVPFLQVKREKNKNLSPLKKSPPPCSPNEHTPPRQTSIPCSPNEHKEEQGNKNRDNKIIHKDSDITETRARENPPISEFSGSSLPSSKKDKKEQQSLNKTKPDWTAKLSPEEKSFHDELISYKPPLGKPLESDAFTAFLKQYGLDKTKQAFKFYLQRVKKGKEKPDLMPRSIGAVMRDALKNERKPLDDDHEKNRKYVLMVKQQHRQFHVTEKYVTLEEMSWDLPFSMPHEAFKSQILKKVEYLKGR